MSAIFLVFTAESIASTFFITAGTFGAMSLYGYTTKQDLTRLGSLLFMALIGLLIASLVNMFMRSTMLYWITTFAGVLIFTGLTAYDTQKIKNMNIIGNEGTDEDRKEAIMGALTLYLDFINLFLYLLRIFGKRK
jgi:FtsH-binding integral membrane protein